MRKIQWIQFSDLHMNETGAETGLLREQLPKYLRSLNLHYDYAFFAGDVRYAPMGTFPANAAAYLRQVCEAACVPYENLFVVPGNHDINRNLPNRHETVLRIYNSRDYQNPGYCERSDGNIKDEDLEILYQGQEEYRGFLSSLFSDMPDRLALYQKPLHPHFCVKTPDLNIVHVDSTLTYTENQERDLLIGSAKLSETLSQIDPAKPTALLTHYSYDFLKRSEQVIVNLLLQNKNVMLWLAGHEHEQLCRPQRDSFYEFQSGNLLMEDGSRACILTGSLDLDTGEGEVHCHAWFTGGGWAPYPFVRNGKDDNTVYPFVYRHSSGFTMPDASQEEIHALQFCEMLEGNGRQFDDAHINTHLLPDLQLTSNVFANSTENNSLIAAMESLWMQKRERKLSSCHALLLGDGGMGKSTLLFHSCKQLLARHKLTVYASLQALQNAGSTICSHILRTLYRADDESSRNRLCRLIADEHTYPDLILFVDGFNELNSDMAHRYAVELKELSSQPGIQIIVSSRLDFLRNYGMTNFQMLRACELRDEQIKSLFDELSWQDIEGKRPLHILLKNPMMALLYAKTSPIVEKYKDLLYCDWILPITNSSELLHNYYLAQVALTLDRGESAEKICTAYLTVRYVLPYLGYQAEIENHMGWDDTRFEIVFANAIHIAEDTVFKGDILPEALQRIKRIYRISIQKTLSNEQIYDALISELCLLRSHDRTLSFHHQIYRDYLAAEYYYQSLLMASSVPAIWKDNKLCAGVIQNLRSMHGELWGDSGLMTEKLSAYRNFEIPESDHFVENLLHCWLPEGADKDVVRDLSTLDLRNISLADELKIQYNGRIDLNGAMVSKKTFVNEERHDRIVSLAFSHDGHTLAALSVNGIVSVSNILTQSQMIVGKLESRRDAKVGFTVDDYLFIHTDQENIKWSTITYDKIEKPEQNEIWNVEQVPDQDDPADKLLTLLRDSEMLGTEYCVSDDRQLVAVGFASGHIQVWSTVAENILAELSLGDSQVVTAAFSESGNYAAIGAGGMLIQLWDVKKQKCRRVLHFDKPVRKVRFPASASDALNQYLECEYSDGHCFRIQIRTGEQSESERSHMELAIKQMIRKMLRGRNIQKIEVADNGNAIVMQSNSPELWVWNQKEHKLNPCKGHVTRVIDAAICKADPRYAASYSDETIRELGGQKVIRAWAIRVGNCMQRLSTQHRSIKRIQFFTTNRIILAAFTTNGDIMLWELNNRMVHGEEWGHWDSIKTVRNGPSDPLECAVSTTDELFIGAYSDGTIFSQKFAGTGRHNFRVFPGIDLSSVAWDSLKCGDSLGEILQAYKE